jgi:sec-independent protein translocase protein TatC
VLRRASNPDAAMPFLEHLDELRTRLIRALVALAVGVVIAFPLRKQLFNVLMLPRSLRVQNLVADGLEWVGDRGMRNTLTAFTEVWLRATTTDDTPFRPNFRDPMGPFTALFKLVLMAGFLIAAPVILYQVWCFVVPALKHTERRIAVRLSGLLAGFFMLGVLFSFFVASPIFLEVSANLWRGAGITDQPENLWTYNDYISFLMHLMLAFGVAFELPLVMAFLARVDIVRASTYREKRRVAFFVLIVASALLTPGDIVPMLLMAIPLLGLYEFGIVLATLAARRLPPLPPSDDEMEALPNE